MEDLKEQSPLEVIRAHYPKLFPAEQKVAAFILEHPEEAVDANVSELANLSGVSEATVVRMCKRVGYEGHYQFRLSLARELGRQQAPQGNGVSLDDSSDVFRLFANEFIEIGSKIGGKNLEKCVAMIRSAGCVHLAAVGNASPFAQYMGFRLGRLGIRASYNLLPEYFMNHINLAGKDDIVIAISQSGSSKSVLQAMELAKKKGLGTIAITAHAFSPISRLADCLLLSAGTKKRFDYARPHSYLNEMAVIDAVLYLLAREQSNDSSASTPEILLSETKL
nr:MurR/RpiR family transcriptional regulator [Bacillota bacterium]